jgi:hypothetical protein
VLTILEWIFGGLIVLWLGGTALEMLFELCIMSFQAIGELFDDLKRSHRRRQIKRQESEGLSPEFKLKYLLPRKK